MASGRRDRRRSIITRRRVPVGAPPGTLVVDPTAAQPVMRVMTWSETACEEHENVRLDDLAGLRSRGSRIWLDVVGTGDTAFFESLGSLFGIDPLVLEDVVNLNQRPKAEDYPGYAYVVLHMVSGLSVGSREQLSIIFGRDFVITVQERADDCLDPVRERLRRGKPRIRAAKGDYLAYAIIDAVVDAYFPLAENLGEQLEEMEDIITVDPEPEHIARLHGLKRELVSLKRSLWPMREVMSALRDEDNDIVEHDTRRYLRDVHDHVLQLIDIIETCREIATGLHDLYLSSISNRMNEVMKVLTIIATIFIPLSFLAGIWGMNFTDMPELHWAHGYPLALGTMALIALGLLGWFRWKDWL
ncbi:magnesium and cobalt transport protein CorA [Zhengella mangrovi]|uniref:Magnesium transport protein CorA n=1 Tax=Zhengella mangrovi TaxID=1982044 RepID=A0A2G1QU07_9HYPH|nr:magnesium/cobalt transporter CorA [Zhengella mangrovi]PHP69046.1 magnesium and cobalt transport protein CorA [Zhengella mangrovi]